MNTDSHDKKWQDLLAASASTFTGPGEPPYGFVTRTVARLQEQDRERDLMARIGLRAIFTSLALLAVVAAVTYSLPLQDRFDGDPGVISIMQMSRISVS